MSFSIIPGLYIYKVSIFSLCNRDQNDKEVVDKEMQGCSTHKSVCSSPSSNQSESRTHSSHHASIVGTGMRIPKYLCSSFLKYNVIKKHIHNENYFIDQFNIFPAFTNHSLYHSPNRFHRYQSDSSLFNDSQQFK